MKSFAILLLVLAFGWLGHRAADSVPATATLQAGAAAAPINPAPGAFIAGGDRNRRFSGVHDSLFAKALVVSEAGGAHWAILTFDCIGMLHPTLEAIRAAVAERLPATEFAPDRIVMASSHTHSGPDVVGIWGAELTSSGVDAAYLEQVVATATDVLVRAWQNRQPVTVYGAETTFGTDWVYNISEPGELDRAVAMLQFRAADGRSVATLTNFACHPTILDGSTAQVSADYVGGLYRYLDRELGGQNLFLQGAIGGWVQPEYETKDFATAFRRGDELGRTVAQHLAQAKQLAQTTLDFRSQLFQLPVSNPGFQQLAAIGVIDRQLTDSVRTEIAWFSLGPAYFVTHPGETVPAYSLQSKALMPDPGPKFVVGLGQDALGYIVKPSFFNPADSIPHAGYLTSMSVDRAAGPLVMAVVEELAKR
jgi:hypothetical protein